MITLAARATVTATVCLCSSATALLSCRGWGARLASLGKAVQSRLPGFMAAPALTTADIPDSTTEDNSRTQSAQDVSGGRSVQPWDATSPAPEGAVEEVMPVTLQEAQELPPVTLMSSTADIIVPWLVNIPPEKLVEQPPLV